MKDIIAIIAGEPASINSEIIAKSWKIINPNNKKKILIIGNYSIIREQLNKIAIKIPLQKINSIENFKYKKSLLVLNVPLKFDSPFKTKPNESRKYVLKCLSLAHRLCVQNKIKGFINASIDKKIFKSKYLGVTEYLAKKNAVKDNVIMLIHNNRLSTVPLTTHLPIKDVTKKIKYQLIKNKIQVLNKLYKILFKRKKKIAILELNPHNSENQPSSIENKIIKPAVQKLKSIGINIIGPYPADTIYSNRKKFKYDVIVGMYHDQVIAPFKAIFGYDAINITLGLKYIRVSPDHGTAFDLVGLNKANPTSLISAIKFLNSVRND